ncbi:TPA: hypothetical protein ACQTYG_005736 [Pseudomonas aeruginosa]|uniref:hypothetical protein n=1 Tax=Pseudomonas aeruginosa TaxID=287 RepID=UPI0024B3C9C6|nr:hypothetical protein [Pseudomonas aeruginosa]MDS9914776.1 hypothetical protein [Pseudomonas aeruginosa]CAI9794743.1 DUF5753 domain-containing protein [Pseudomonas aeruginosa]CAI9912132.1 DUF5753 domain-containing protein [Pseudomonas aeruginosa]HBO1619788.1 hypothetical protein [Pseudomonas aeruginosa]HBO9386108.1 hypothetical protein [Pseudomonas aeruginosa]
MALTPIFVSGDLSIPSDQLDSWADIYFEAKTAGLMHVPLSVFLSDPMRYIAEGGQPVSESAQDDEFLPLLPRQAEVATRIQEQWAREDAQRGSHLTLVASR